MTTATITSKVTITNTEAAFVISDIGSFRSAIARVAGVQQKQKQEQVMQGNPEIPMQPGFKAMG